MVVGVDATAATHQIYVNGALAGSYGGDGPTWLGGTDLNLGGTRFNGGLQDSNSDYDELAIYNLSSVASGGDLTARFADLADHFNVASTPDPGAPVMVMVDSYSFPNPAAQPGTCAGSTGRSRRRASRSARR